LGDIGNVNYVTGLSTSLNFSKVEEIKQPKEEFMKIYSEHRSINDRRALSYPELVTQLFSSVNVQTLKLNSKTFAIFLTELQKYLKRSGLI
jgi:hypothetical protein